MQLSNLGNTTLRVSPLCLGMMNYGSPAWRPWIQTAEQAQPTVQRALDLGVNFFDTADMYSAGVSEELTGRWIRAAGKREDFVIASKVYFPVAMDYKYAGGGSAAAPPDQGLSRARILRCVEDSLRRLGTDYLDLYYIHRWDYQTPIEQTMQVLHELVRAGKVRYLGASSMYAWQFAKAQRLAEQQGLTPFSVMQNHYNLVYREEEREMIPLCRDLGVAVVPWSPLARGFLAGNRGVDAAKQATTERGKTDHVAQKYYFREVDFAVVDRLTEVAKARGVSNAVMAYAWLRHKGMDAIIVGASKPSQVDDAFAALSLTLQQDEIKVLEEPYMAHAVIGHE
jgi:1-deoxyxylulose-5-phosphate synthase